MGYETRIHVVSLYRWDLELPQSGRELAMLDLCKTGSGAVYDLIASHTKSDGNPVFALYARNPDRQGEAAAYLREISEAGFPRSQEDVEKLADNIEDGKITRDCYGDLLGVIPIDEFIAALAEDIAADTPAYRRFLWALALLQSIKASWERPADLMVVTYGY